MEKLKWESGFKRLSDLNVWDKNPRTITDQNFEDLVKQIDKVGFTNPFIIDTDDTIVAGHQRRKALIELHRENELVPVRYPNRKLTQIEFESIAIGDNKFLGDFDQELLKQNFDFDFLLNNMNFEKQFLIPEEITPKEKQNLDVSDYVQYSVKISPDTRKNMHDLTKELKAEFGYENSDQVFKTICHVMQIIKSDDNFKDEF